MPILHVNVDHVATIREARKTTEPDPVYAALQAEQAGAKGITMHLREDRRHVNDRDIQLAKELIQTKLNMEMAATEEMCSIALKIQPNIVTLVPEKREEITTEGGLDCLRQKKVLEPIINRLQEQGIRISLFIDPVSSQVETAQLLSVSDIELHTGEYANASSEKEQKRQVERLQSAAALAKQSGLQVNAGHGLTYFNVETVAAIPQVEELNIGHSIIARSVYTGISQAVKDMVNLICPLSSKSTIK